MECKDIYGFNLYLVKRFSVYFFWSESIEVGSPKVFGLDLAWLRRHFMEKVSNYIYGLQLFDCMQCSYLPLTFNIRHKIYEISLFLKIQRISQYPDRIKIFLLSYLWKIHIVTKEG